MFIYLFIFSLLVFICLWEPHGFHSDFLEWRLCGSFFRNIKVLLKLFLYIYIYEFLFLFFIDGRWKKFKF